MRRRRFLAGGLIVLSLAVLAGVVWFSEPVQDALMNRVVQGRAAQRRDHAGKPLQRRPVGQAAVHLLQCLRSVWCQAPQHEHFGGQHAGHLQQAWLAAVSLQESQRFVDLQRIATGIPLSLIHISEPTRPY